MGADGIEPRRHAPHSFYVRCFTDTRAEQLPSKIRVKAKEFFLNLPNCFTSNWWGELDLNQHFLLFIQIFTEVSLSVATDLWSVPNSNRTDFLIASEMAIPSSPKPHIWDYNNPNFFSLSISKSFFLTFFLNIVLSKSKRKDSGILILFS